ncbi:hypothetical protein [Solicola sp. PLA-1-18]|uniref:hypothetical protein n=1 Tax=Solicola sp. PLA-1-18 TaxID=3380532 RepID=UPI003B77BD21
MIDYARAAADPTCRLYPHQIDTTDAEHRHRVWLCGGCTARVAPRRSHTRAGGTRVLAHFATWPRVDDDSTPHDDACAFLPHQRPSSASTNDEKHTAGHRGIDIAATWVLAPVVPTTDHRVDDRAMTPSKGAEDSDGPSSTGQPGSDAPARSSITDAHRILDLLRHFDDQPRQMLKFAALWQPGHGQPSTELGWGDLYFPPSRHHLLLQQARDHSIPDHPVAVTGQVQQITRTHNRRRDADDLSIFLRVAATDSSDRLVLRGPPHLMPPTVRQADTLLVLASWSAFTPSHRNVSHTSTTYCTAWIVTNQQVIQTGPHDPLD